MIHKLEEIESFQNYQNEFETDKAMLLLTSKFNAIRTPGIHENILIEKDGVKKNQELLAGLDIGQVRKGIVRKITHYGAFVDIGGLDGLLRIADMSWCRISHPSEMLAVNDEIEVKILDVDRESGKVALGLRQKYEGVINSCGRETRRGVKGMWAGYQYNAIRCVCKAGIRCKRTCSQLGNVLDSIHHQSIGDGKYWRYRRGCCN